MKRKIREEESLITEYDGNIVQYIKYDDELKRTSYSVKKIHYNHYCDICNKVMYESDEEYKDGILISSDESIRRETEYDNKYIIIETYNTKIRYKANGMDICNECLDHIVEGKITELLETEYKFKVDNS